MKVVKYHWFALILTFIVGVISVFPNLIFINSSFYQGLPIMATDAEVLYLTRINAVVEKGCILNCNPYIKEYKYNFPHFDSSISESILSLLVIITNTPTVLVQVFYSMVLVTALFFLVYLLILRLTASTYIALLGASLIVLAHNLINIPDLINFLDIIDLFEFKTHNSQFLIYSRPVNPQFSSIFFILYLHILLSAAVNKTKKWYIILALMYGVSFYIYFFTYAFATVVQGLWIGLYIIKKDIKSIGNLILSTCVGLVIAIPQFIQIFSLMQHPYKYTIPLDYLVKTHAPDISSIGLSLIILFIAFMYVLRMKGRVFSVQSYFVIILVTSCFITRNQHVISGMIMQYDHFEMYIFTPILIISICYMVYSLLIPIVSIKSQLVIFFLIIICFFNASYIQMISFRLSLDNAIYIQKYASVLNWLKVGIEKDSIISAPPGISKFISLYANKYVLWTYYAGQWISVPGRIEDAVRSRNSTCDLLEVGKKYKVDYFVEDKKGNLLKNTELEKLYEDEMFVVYKANY